MDLKNRLTMRFIKGAVIGGAIGISAPILLATINESIFILKRLNTGADIFNTVQICAFNRRWYPLYPKVLDSPGCENKTLEILPGIITAAVIGGGIAGSAASLLLKDKKIVNNKGRKSKVSHGTN